MLFMYWTIYVLIGILWLWRFSKKQPKNKEYNVIGSLFITVMWPFHMIYNFFKV